MTRRRTARYRRYPLRVQVVEALFAVAVAGMVVAGLVS